jgi:hypothetical protein
MELTTLVERTQQIRDALPLPNMKQRLAAAAAELSNAGDNQTRVEDPDGVLRNVDRKTYRILVKMPWGRGGWQFWGLRYWEAEQLRSILRVRCQMQRVPPLFDWNEYSMKWHLNFSDYPRLDLALLYWKRNAITLSEWRNHADAYRQRAQTRMAKHRGKQEG